MVKTKYLLYGSIIILILLITIAVSSKAPDREIVIHQQQTESKVMVIVEEVGWRIVTGYSSTKDQCDEDPFITASQKRVRDGVIACPRYYPFGTKILIEGKVYDCEDRMNSGYIHRFDIWFPTREDAELFGKQILKIKKVEIY